MNNLHIQDVPEKLFFPTSTETLASILPQEDEVEKKTKFIYYQRMLQYPDTSTTGGLCLVIVSSSSCTGYTRLLYL